ncbi:MAG TPA: DUF1444 family protein [Accumulibacter sp.]|jgi:uncharacterized protein YtpQ (UPF0354 family)|nr:DUF1444 family protein [Accumulibacter sp.]HQC79735.1 DUF1444 family protein [Accumulibacter sp.]
MKKVAAIFCIFVSSLSFASQMLESDFTQYFTNRASEVLKDVQFRVLRPLQVNSKDVNGYELTIFLDNAYAQYRSVPDNLRSIVDSHIQSIRSQRDLLGAKTAKSIFGVVKPADYLITVRRQLTQAGLGDKELPLVFERVNDELYVFYVFDSDNGIRMITKKDLAEIKVAETTIRSIATQNLSTYFDKKGVTIRPLDKIGNAKVYLVSLDENYEASILLLSKYWNKQTFDVRGQLVAFVPARNMVLVTGAGDSEGMRIAGYLASSAFKEAGYAISPKGFVNEAGSWKVYKPSQETHSN